jgi:hypothetical protein
LFCLVIYYSDLAFAALFQSSDSEDVKQLLGSGYCIAVKIHHAPEVPNNAVGNIGSFANLDHCESNSFIARGYH